MQNKNVIKNIPKLTKVSLHLCLGPRVRVWVSVCMCTYTLCSVIQPALRTPCLPSKAGWASCHLYEIWASELWSSFAQQMPYLLDHLPRPPEPFVETAPSSQFPWTLLLDKHPVLGAFRSLQDAALALAFCFEVVVDSTFKK